MTTKKIYLLILMFILISTTVSIPSESCFKDSLLETKPYTKFLSSQENVSLILSYSTNEDVNLKNVSDSDVLVGDHIVLNAVFNNTNPDIEITGCEISVPFNELHDEVYNITVPDEDYDPFSGILNRSQFSWAIVEGLRKGAEVNITANFTNGDCDFFVFSGDMDPDTYSYASNLVDSRMSTGARPESTNLTWQSSNDTMLVGCFDYDLQEGNWTLTVHQYGEILSTSDTHIVSYDTYRFGMNRTTSLTFNCTTDEQETYTFEYSNLTFNNFFTPKITDFTFTDFGSLVRFSWNITDRNKAEFYDSDLYLSGDGGNTFQLLAFNLEETEYQFDSSGFAPRDDYYAKVRVTDSSGLFTEKDIGPLSFVDESMSGFDAQAVGPDSVSFQYGETVHISWTITLTGFAPPEIDYFIYLDITLIKTGKTSGGNISVNIPGLAPGNYTVKLCLIDSETLRDVVQINVAPRPLWQTVMFQTISVVSAGVMLLFSILIFDHFYKKRKSQQDDNE